MRANWGRALAIACALSIAVPAVGWSDDGPGVDFNVLKIDNLVVGKTFEIGPDFAAEHDIDIAAPFKITVPTSEDFLTLVEPAPKPGEAYVKFNFGTLDRLLTENLQFIRMRIPDADTAKRMEITARLLAHHGFSMVVQGHGGPSRDSVRKIKIGPYDAIEVIGRYTRDPEGLVYVRIVGIPHPDQEASVFAVANVIAAQSGIETFDDLVGKTKSGLAMTSFRYLDAE